MTLSISISCHTLYAFISLSLLFPYAKPLSFNFTNFSPNMQPIDFEGDAFPSNNVLQLTKNDVIDIPTSSVGRASYNTPVRLWDASNRKLTDFTTHFSFIMTAVNKSKYGDGISFFMAPFDSKIPQNSSDGFLALFNRNAASNNSSNNNIVAVEFDSFQNDWDPSDDHVGININSIKSVKTVTWGSNFKNGSRLNAWVSYNSSTKNLSIFLNSADNPVFSGNSSLSYSVDLRDFLPEWIRIGFSASTGSQVELHNILNWSFDSSLGTGGSGKGKNLGLTVGLAAGFGLFSCGLGFFLFILWRIKARLNKESEIIDVTIEDEFEKGTGPKRFTYNELNRATNNFSEEGKLGEGGFGGVYRGLLSDSTTEVAVKRVSRGSKQGKMEYISEVKIISRLRHKNLVKLLGWCHEKGDLLLVYEFLPNGSLDSHLFRENCTLTWAMRHKICLNLATALHYLHNDWEQCVVHRDIKAGNVILDSNFNAKLGDFGLAKLMDHEIGPPTTLHLAGTLGYMAPEYIKTGKPSSKSDVYSFGVVTLEIATGRRARDPRNYDIGLVEWVWSLYEQDRLVSGIDERLQMEFDEKQAKCTMFVGVWCTHPDKNSRPSIRQAIQVLNFEAEMPDFATNMPVLMCNATSLLNIPSQPSITNSFLEAGR